jgi:sugar-specific transcriptional regulator TrmB
MTIKVQNAKNALLSLGFSEKEASVYMYLLERGDEVGGSKIAVGTKLHRQYVYNALQKLIEQDLVEEVPKGKLSKYKAFPPKELEKIAKRRLIETEDAVKLLERFSKAGHQQESEVLFGLRDLAEHEYQFEDNAEVGEKQYIIGGNGEAFIQIMEDHYYRLKQLDEKKKIVTYYIGSKRDKADEKLHLGRESRFHMRYMEKMPEGITHIVIRKDRVCFFSFLSPPTIHIIKSPVVAENFKDFFLMLWEMAERR